MRVPDPDCLDRQTLLGYFLGAARPRRAWQVGMEVEKLGRDAASGRPLPYDGAQPSVRGVLDWLRERRGGDPILEAHNLVGIDAEWGTISLEPGGQIEWSSRPRSSLDTLDTDLQQHLEALRECGDALGVRWLTEAVDPELPVDAMPWMPKARYKIMKSFLGARGRLAQRMMTQTASIQCAFDYEDPADWARKFRLAALLSPVALALFANSSRVDGAESGWRSYRHAIWRETDPARCLLPPVAFSPQFDIEHWLDWVLSVPTMFLRRGRGLVPVGGVPFSELLRRQGCLAVRPEDWEAHISTVFTEVRSYTYIEVRCADLQPDELALAVPAFWTGILYSAVGSDAFRELGVAIDGHAAWIDAMETAGRLGLEGRVGRRPLLEWAAEALAVASHGLAHGVPCAGESGAARAALERLAARRRIPLPA